MTKGRLEAFSDGVIAIIITIMILELKKPHGADWEAIRPVVPGLLTYVLSYVFLGIYWSNHHHMLHAADRVNGAILWANLHFLFWLSLIPFMTSWIAEEHFAPVPTALYGGLLLMSSMGYWFLFLAIVADHGPHSKLAQAVGKNHKGHATLGLYAVAIPLALVNPWIAYAIYVLVAVMWLVPDRRIETHLHGGH